MDTCHEYMLEDTSGRKSLSNHHQFGQQIGILNSWTGDADQPWLNLVHNQFYLQHVDGVQEASLPQLSHLHPSGAPHPYTCWSEVCPWWERWWGRCPWESPLLYLSIVCNRDGPLESSGMRGWRCPQSRSQMRQWALCGAGEKGRWPCKRRLCKRKGGREGRRGGCIGNGEEYLREGEEQKKKKMTTTWECERVVSGDWLSATVGEFLW